MLRKQAGGCALTISKVAGFLPKLLAMMRA
jgi:hypothetical protein